MSNKAKVTVVIPNYNGLKFMDPCFKALDLQLCRDFDILVVDNGSTDGSVEWLKEHEIPSIFLEKNTGFSGAVNVGIKASKTPYVILLNNDTEPDCHYIGEMIKAIERSPEIFSVSSKMIQLYDHSKMDDAASSPRVPSTSRHVCSRNSPFFLSIRQKKTCRFLPKKDHSFR